MTLILVLFTMVIAWLATAMAMLWGVMRIARRHSGQARKVAGSPVPMNFRTSRWRSIVRFAALPR
jgi:hypothetical protein